MPEIGPDVVLEDPAFIHPSVHLYGKVTVRAGASLWCNVVGRAENFEIEIGERTNVQDFVMLHVGDRTGTYIGSHCSITHHCTLHGCRIGDNCLIGINATIMDGCEIGDNSVVAGHTILTEGTKVPPNSVVMGVPGQVRRTANNFVRNRANAFLYYRNALAYRDGRHREWSRPETVAALQAELERLRAELAAMQAGE